MSDDVRALVGMGPLLDVLRRIADSLELIAAGMTPPPAPPPAPAPAHSPVWPFTTVAPTVRHYGKPPPIVPIEAPPEEEPR